MSAVSDLNEFVSFNSIPRLFREIMIMEKVDGTNGQICVQDDLTVKVGSREKWITPEDDNRGFARWVKANEPALATGLGPGRHFGEWYGSGIGRGYGLKEKRFALFNATRWTDDVRPSLCGVVPVLYDGPFATNAVLDCLTKLKETGSVIVPGFTRPEGVIIFFKKPQLLFKVTLDGDGHKGEK